MARQKTLEEELSAPDFWNDKEHAQKVMQEVGQCRNTLEPFLQLEKRLGDLEALLELLQEDSEDADLLAEANTTCSEINAALDKLELVSFLGGEFDKANCFMTLAAGAGGTEAQDWCEMLLRMYLRYCERKGFQVDVLDRQDGDVAGVKTVTLHVKGTFAYGYLKAEHGVHRLVRISPFDSNQRRHTSFAGVEISPEIDQEIDIEIDEKDLRVDTYRSSGAGGQHVNTTDSAVRITHIPTGIVVSCQAERSQHQNRHYAMLQLKAKLYELERRKKEELVAQQTGEKAENAWGSQIRSYVLHPYRMVKDLRTGIETSDTGAVLDGDLDMFIEAFLRHRQKHGKAEVS